MKRFQEQGNGVIKKRKSRWGEESEADKNILNGIPTYIPSGLTKCQEDQYILQLQVEEITRRLRTGELGIPENASDRSPSPEPMYSSDGKRLNTREYRVRKTLEEKRHKLIQSILKDNLEYKPPADYRAPSIKINDRVYIPQDEHSDINFIGLLIGPRGNTLRMLEKETGTTVIIRGKGSVKDGKLAIKDGKPLPGQDEPLHAYITATDPDNIKLCIQKIKKIIQEGIAVPDGDNELRKQQLKELALLNGTFKENDALGKLRQMQEAQTIVTNTIICTMCGGAGHISQDCKQRRPSEGLTSMLKNSYTPLPVRSAAIDSEYMSLMSELGQEVPQHLMGRHGVGTVGGGGQFGRSFGRALELPAPRYSSLPDNMCNNNGSNNSQPSSNFNSPPGMQRPGGWPHANEGAPGMSNRSPFGGGQNFNQGPYQSPRPVPNLMDIQARRAMAPPPVPPFMRNGQSPIGTQGGSGPPNMGSPAPPWGNPMMGLYQNFQRPLTNYPQNMPPPPPPM